MTRSSHGPRGKPRIRDRAREITVSSSTAAALGGRDALGGCGDDEPEIKTGQWGGLGTELNVTTSGAKEGSVARGVASSPRNPSSITEHQRPPRGPPLSGLTPGARRLLAAILVTSPFLPFLLRPHPEVVTGALVTSSLVFRHDGRRAAAVLAMALASLQAAPLALAAALFWAEGAWGVRGIGWDASLRAVGRQPGARPGAPASPVRPRRLRAPEPARPMLPGLRWRRPF